MYQTFLRVTNLSNKNSDNFMSPVYTERGKELVLPPVRVYSNSILLCTSHFAYYFPAVTVSSVTSLEDVTC